MQLSIKEKNGVGYTVKVPKNLQPKIMEVLGINGGGQDIVPPTPAATQATFKVEPDYSRNGKYWLEDEVNELIRLTNTGKPPRDIAVIFKRKPVSVSSKLAALRAEGRIKKVKSQ